MSWKTQPRFTLIVPQATHRKSPAFKRCHLVAHDGTRRFTRSACRQTSAQWAPLIPRSNGGHHTPMPSEGTRCSLLDPSPLRTKRSRSRRFRRISPRQLRMQLRRHPPKRGPRQLRRRVRKRAPKPLVRAILRRPNPNSQRRHRSPNLQHQRPERTQDNRRNRFHMLRQ